ncbi:MAG TPA: NADPH-dependent F420 reductase [Burkholderiales bacterium]|nr:NADPH-dependent F420 reductase [Burkholderiales bacterium]
MSGKATIAVLGGTGAEGSGLAFRWALAGHEVIVGSRSAEKASAAAAELNTLLAGKGGVRGATNTDAARAAQIVVLTVPYAAQRATAIEVRAELEGKILVDVTVPLAPPVDRVQLPNGESAVLALQRELGPDVQVVSAFQNVSATHLKDPAHEIDCDVLVCGDDRDARERVVVLAQDAGLRAVHAGALANSAAVEAMTSVLIAINKHYKVRASGIRVTGVPAEKLARS